MSSSRTDQLVEALSGPGPVLILPHTDPDPDALAAALALRQLVESRGAIPAQVAYSGIVGRAENKALLRYLGQPVKRLTSEQLDSAERIALVDTQPGAGNNALPQDRRAAVVIDHHPLKEASAGAAYAEVRPELGATSTILWEHFQAAGLEPPTPLATAMFYGIKTDTMGLGRGASPQDVAAYFDLQPRIDVESLYQIERAQVPAEYFESFARALHSTRLYDGVVVTDLGPMHYPDLAAEMADLLSRLQEARWVICLGTFRDNLVLAVRSRSQRQGAGKLARVMVGERGTAGGHGTYAGGQVLIGDDQLEDLKSRLVKRALDFLELAPETAPRPLLGQLDEARTEEER
jgi:nanoRNase/pAp phosphatase (c-di-AMP/oligoRNAs hydrolase)